MKLAHILLLVEEVELREVIQHYLLGRGYHVSSRSAHYVVDELINFINAERVELLILDLIFASTRDHALLKAVRERSDARIVLLADQLDPAARIASLESGADECLAKPIYLRELAARAKNLLSRHQAFGSERMSETLFSFLGWRVDANERALFDMDSKKILLSSTEYGLLLAFLENPNRIISREELLHAVRHRRWRPEDRSIDVQIGHLRRKIETDHKSPSIIKTVHGLGYIFTPIVTRRSQSL